MSETAHETAPYAIVPHDVPVAMIESFMVMHGSPQELADIEGTQHDIRDHLPNLHRIISKITYLGLEATPLERQQASRVAYNLFNVLNRLVTTDQLEQALTLEIDASGATDTGLISADGGASVN